MVTLCLHLQPSFLLLDKEPPGMACTVNGEAEVANSAVIVASKQSPERGSLCPIHIGIRGTYQSCKDIGLPAKINKLAVRVPSGGSHGCNKRSHVLAIFISNNGSSGRLKGASEACCLY